MPRLVGKRSDNDSAIALVILLLAIAAVVGAEYSGYIDVVPGFGREQTTRVDSY